MTTSPSTVSQAQAHLARQLSAGGVASPQPEARALLMHVLDTDWAGLVLAGASVLTGEQASRIDALLQRRLAGEPLQHLTGLVEWGGLRLHVSPAALIPRPETEVLLTLAMDALRHRAAPQVLDVGTGSGALALAVKAARPDAHVTATDISADALALARENARLHTLDLTFLQADLLAGVPGVFDVVVSNPPYLPDADRALASPELRHDPDAALYSGPDGLTLARRLVRQAQGALALSGRLLLELDPRNVDVLAAELTQGGWTTTVHEDLAGRRRFLVGTAPEAPA